MNCQRCESDRVLIIGGHGQDRFYATFQDYEKDGYAPHIENVCGGDDINIEVCLECGQMQGTWPVKENPPDEDDRWKKTKNA